MIPIVNLARKNSIIKQPLFNISRVPSISRMKRNQSQQTNQLKQYLFILKSKALHQLDLADTSNDPTLAINTYWTQAQFLYQHKRPEYTSRALRSLIDLLCLNPTTSLSPAYMTFYLYNSRLALARLLCMYQQVQEAQDIYLDALETKWKLDKPSLINIAKHTRQHTVEALLASCESLAIKYLTRERNRTKPAPPLTDMNNAFSVILNEGGNLFAQETGMDLSEPIAIVLYGLGSLVCPFENRMRPQDFHCLMQSVYTSLGLIHRQIEVKLLDKQDPWCLFDAFLTSLEIGK
ncbi:uncharacterized protein B0P05DRAFT_183236 [Gilbertella persicaria]|uniref:uncharacterized protein n=1 Tax=Gilbertella persicaria TaxID=101096 RepID=UPI00221EDBE7|nr:uncharacterized protein B0P05DRAFT_183236 [Gilbertella persicaria]KAI8070548.1 hypothetical protein B0P05DRAFT_183236 [Gilbertella persicaria]